MVRQVVKFVAALREKPIQPNRRPLPERHHPALASLALADQQGPVGRVVIATVEVRHFRAANARGVKQLEDRPVAQAERVRRVGDRHHPVDLIGSE